MNSSIDDSDFVKSYYRQSELREIYYILSKFREFLLQMV